MKFIWSVKDELSACQMVDTVICLYFCLSLIYTLKFPEIMAFSCKVKIAFVFKIVDCINPVNMISSSRYILSKAITATSLSLSENCNMVVVYKYTTKTDEKPVKNEFLYKRNGRLCKYYLCKNDKIRTTKRNNC